MLIEAAVIALVVFLASLKALQHLDAPARDQRPEFEPTRPEARDPPPKVQTFRREHPDVSLEHERELSRSAPSVVVLAERPAPSEAVAPARAVPPEQALPKRFDAQARRERLRQEAQARGVPSRGSGGGRSRGGRERDDYER